MRAAPTILCGAIALLLGAAGCSSARYVFRPEENATARVSGRLAAYYEVPPASPRGAVRVANLGIANLHPRSGEGPSMRVMHMRMVVDNDADSGPWQFDTREQLGSIGGYGQSRPAYAWVSPGQPPLVSVPAGATVKVDLFYPLPEKMQKESEIPQFDLLWKVGTPAGPVAQRTTFERVRIEPTPPPGAYAYDEWWGPGWNGWYDPLWPDYAFWGAPAGPVYYSRPVINVAPPAHRVR